MRGASDIIILSRVKVNRAGLERSRKYYHWNSVSGMRTSLGLATSSPYTDQVNAVEFVRSGNIQAVIVNETITS